MLTAATYDPTGSLFLTFDQAVDIAAIDLMAFVVSDNLTNIQQYAGASAELLSPEVVRIVLTATGPSSGSGVWMTATSSNNILAVVDGAAWLGVTDLVLPFP